MKLKNILLSIGLFGVLILASCKNNNDKKDNVNNIINTSEHDNHDEGSDDCCKGEDETSTETTEEHCH